MSSSRSGPIRFSVSDALQLVEHGIIPEDSTIELLNGILVYRDRFGLRDNDLVESIEHQLRRISTCGSELHDQQQ